MAYTASKPFPFLCLKVTRRWKHAAGEPGCSLVLCVCAYDYIYFYISECVHIYMLLFVDAYRTSNKNLSRGFCWKGWASIRQTQRSGCGIRQVLTVLQIIPLSHPGFLAHLHPSLHTQIPVSSAQSTDCFTAPGELFLVRWYWASMWGNKHSQTLLNQPHLWGGQSSCLQLRVREGLVYMWYEVHLKENPFLTTARLAWSWMLGLVRAPLGVKETSLSVPSIRTDQLGGGLWPVNFSTHSSSHRPWTLTGKTLLQPCGNM